MAPNSLEKRLEIGLKGCTGWEISLYTWITYSCTLFLYQIKTSTKFVKGWVIII